VTDTNDKAEQRDLGKRPSELHNHNSLPASIVIQKASERLRQERETFEQKKFQDARWFILRMAMGILAVVIIPTLIVICVLIISNPHQATPVKGLAASALLVDILGLAGAVWKIILSPPTVTQLTPVTQDSGDSLIYTDQNQPAADQADGLKLPGLPTDADPRVGNMPESSALRVPLEIAPAFPR
jgi:hypothetical protein